MNDYKVVYYYVDFPMGVSPSYQYRQGLTKEEAAQLVKNLNKKSKDCKSSVYKVYEILKTQN